jgi:hypothetical protein
MKLSPITALLTTCLVAGSLTAPALPAKTRADIAHAPLPAKILSAKKIFLLNGGDDLAYDTVYAAVKKWGRFELVDSPAAADLTVEINWSLTQSGYGAARASVPRVQFVLTVFDAATRDPLWSETGLTRFARLEKNREKEIISTTEHLVAVLKSRVEP